MPIYKPTSATDAAGRSLVQDDQNIVANKPSYFFQNTNVISGSLGSSINSDVTFLTFFKIAQLLSGETRLLSLYGSGATDRLILALSSAGYPQARIREAGNPGADDVLTTTATAVTDNSWHTLVMTRALTGAVNFYLDGVLLPGTYTSSRLLSTNPILWNVSDSVSNWSLSGNVARTLVFNQILSADKIRRYSDGAKLDYADIGGTMSALTVAWTQYSGTFESGFNSTAPTSFSGNNTASTALAYNNYAFGTGRSYKLTFTPTQSLTLSIILSTANAAGDTEVLAASASYTAGVPVTIPYTVTNPLSACIYFAISTTGSPVGITGIQLTQLGAVLDLEPESATPTTWHDESGNQLDGTVTGAQLVNLPHFAMTDYGPAAVKQELVDNSVDKPSYYFPTTTNTISPGSGFTLGDSDLTVVSIAKIASTSATNYTYYVCSNNDARGLNLYAGYPSLGKFAIGTGTTTPGDFSITSVDFPSENYGKWSAICCQRKTTTAGTTQSIYFNGVLAKQESVVLKTMPPVTLHSLGYASTALQNWSCSRHVLFNYALDENKIRRYSAGAKLDYEDVGGSMVNQNLGTALPYTSSASGPWVTIKNADNRVGKRFKVKITYTGGAIHLKYNGSGTTVVNPLVSDQEYTFIEAENNNIYIYKNDATSTTVTAISLVQLGAVLDLEPEGIGEGTWVDSSPNKLNGDVSGALAMFPNQDDPVQGTWLPACTTYSGFASVGTATEAKYRVVNGVCFFEFKSACTTNASGDVYHSFSFTLPVQSRTTTSCINGTSVMTQASFADTGALTDWTSNRTQAGIVLYNRKVGNSQAVSVFVAGWYFI